MIFPSILAKNANIEYRTVDFFFFCPGKTLGGKSNMSDSDFARLSYSKIFLALSCDDIRIIRDTETLSSSLRKKPMESCLSPFLSNAELSD